MTGRPSAEPPSRRAAETSGEFGRLSILIAIAFVDMLGSAVVFPLVPLYGKDFNASPVAIGLVIAAFSIAQLASSPLWGRISDHRGRRPALLAGLLFGTMGFTIFGFATSVWLLFSPASFKALGAARLESPRPTSRIRLAPASRQALGWLSAATNLGVMIGPVIGSLAFRLGRGVPGFIAAGLCLINALCAWKWLPESKAPLLPGEEPPRENQCGMLPAQVIRHPRGPVPRLTWIYSAGMLGLFTMNSVLALYLSEKFGVNENNIGYFFLYIGALSVIMRLLLLGPIVHKLGEPWTVRCGTIALTLGLVLYPLATSWWSLAPIMALVPIGTALLFPSTTALMSHASDRREVGVTMGVAQTFAGMARVIAPLVATFAFQHAGHSWPFLIAGGIVALVGILAFRLDAPAHALRATEKPA